MVSSLFPSFLASYYAQLSIWSLGACSSWLLWLLEVSPSLFEYLIWVISSYTFPAPALECTLLQGTLVPFTGKVVFRNQDLTIHMFFAVGVWLLPDLGQTYEIHTCLYMQDCVHPYMPVHVACVTTFCVLEAHLTGERV